MIYALQATLQFTTATRRNNVKTAIETRIATRPRWGDTSVVAGTENPAPFTLALEVRFTTEAHRDDAYTLLETSARAQAALGRIHRHQCDHDQPNPTPCSVLSEVVL